MQLWNIKFNVQQEGRWEGFANPHKKQKAATMYYHIHENCGNEPTIGADQKFEPVAVLAQAGVPRGIRINRATW